MIRSFRDRATQEVFEGRGARSIPDDVARGARRKMAQLDQVKSVEEMGVPPGNKLHRLRGDREGQHAMIGKANTR